GADTVLPRGSTVLQRGLRPRRSCRTREEDPVASGRRRRLRLDYRRIHQRDQQEAVAIGTLVSNCIYMNGPLRAITFHPYLLSARWAPRHIAGLRTLMWHCSAFVGAAGGRFQSWTLEDVQRLPQRRRLKALGSHVENVPLHAVP